MKIAVIYASTTGNTEAMANAINEALKASGEDVVFGTADSADKAAVLSCDVILLGSPAMGEEVLEDTMEVFLQKLKVRLKERKLESLVLMTGEMDSGSGTGKTV